MDAAREEVWTHEATAGLCAKARHPCDFKKISLVISTPLRYFTSNDDRIVKGKSHRGEIPDESICAIVSMLGLLSYFRIAVEERLVRGALLRGSL